MWGLSHVRVPAMTIFLLLFLLFLLFLPFLWLPLLSLFPILSHLFIFIPLFLPPSISPYSSFLPLLLSFFKETGSCYVLTWNSQWRQGWPPTHRDPLAFVSHMPPPLCFFDDIFNGYVLCHCLEISITYRRFLAYFQLKPTLFSPPSLSLFDRILLFWPDWY